MFTLEKYLRLFLFFYFVVKFGCKGLGNMGFSLIRDCIEWPDDFLCKLVLKHSLIKDTDSRDFRL